MNEHATNIILYIEQNEYYIVDVIPTHTVFMIHIDIHMNTMRYALFFHILDGISTIYVYIMNVEY